jgi:large subunit ribosomal protein L23
MNIASMRLVPRLSEKTYQQSSRHRVFTFDVPSDSNKHQVADAVAAAFDVRVINVNITNIKGKKKQSYRKRQRPIEGQRKSIKKAYVTIHEDDNIPIFGAETAKNKEQA